MTYHPHDLLAEIGSLLENYRESEGHTFEVDDTDRTEALVSVTDAEGVTTLLRLAIHTVGEPRSVLTEREAMAAYEALCKSLGVTPVPYPVMQGGAAWPSGPVLCRQFDDQYRWAIVWEGADEWVHTEVPGVFAEPINHYSLALYPKGSA